MAYADPQSVTISGTAVSLPRTGLSLSEGRFTSGDTTTDLSIAHTRKQRNRHLVKLQKAAIVSDPLVPSTNRPVSYSAHLVVDLPLQGVTAADAKALTQALVAWATAGNIEKLVASES